MVRDPIRAFVASAVGASVVLLGALAHADDLKFGIHAEATGYKDTDATNVITPAINLNVQGVTGGWQVGAGLLVDVVTAASTDIVATASPRWTDIRYVPTINAQFKISDVTLHFGGAGSIESDYYAGSGSASISFDLAQKTITPSFGYSFGYDIAGRRGTPLDVYSLEVMRHAFSAAISFVINKSTIFVPSFDAVVELGDQEKPYRYLPTFAPDTTISAGATREEVDAQRTSVKLNENSPDLRARYALSGLIAHRFDQATLRLEERLYIDSWYLMATTTDFMLPVDVHENVRLWPHLRFHAQKGVAFWEAAYIIDENAQGQVVAPQLRVGDRELGPLLSATGGAGIRIGNENVGVTFSADVVYTRFLDHLYIQNRVAGFGGLVLDVEAP
ncbi:MAG: DUF3570 domain-containing protein [Polyangiaceae bacterium]